MDMETYDIGLAYVWEYDEDFINLLESVFREHNLTTFKIGYHNLAEVREMVLNRSLLFNFYLDRAGDVDDDFEALGFLLHKRKTYFFNEYKKVSHAVDKASMHLEFMTAGLHVPYSIIIPPFNQVEDIFISINDLKRLGRPFIIKPCNTTGGGVGVVTGAETLHEVLQERVNYVDDKYLIQETIYPRSLNGNRAWFRCFWAFGSAIPVWWDDQTHLYKALTRNEITEYELEQLFSIVETIARITNMDFFSTEIVLDESGKFIAIDYVNDQCDMRFQSNHADGVPDSVLLNIINNLAGFIIKKKTSSIK